MKRKIYFSLVSLIVLSLFILWLVMPRQINASKVINLVQSNYKVITINNKSIEVGTNDQYLIDDFIPKLSRYTLKVYEGGLPENNLYKVEIKSNDDSIITLLDNNYLIVDDVKYEIIEGTIDLAKFYDFIETNPKLTSLYNERYAVVYGAIYYVLIDEYIENNDPLNPNVSELVRQYFRYDGISENGDITPYTDMIAIEKVDSLEAAKNVLKEIDSESLRLNDNTIVSEYVKEKWKLENYDTQFEYHKNAPENLKVVGLGVLSLIPEGWDIRENDEGILELQQADLNKDGVNDLVLVIEKDKSTNEVPERALMIAMANKNHGYLESIIGYNTILKSDEGGVWGDPFASVSVDNGVVILNHYGGSNWRWYSTYKFRFQDDDMYLIGATIGSYFTGNTTKENADEIDYNLSTGDYIQKKTDEDGNRKSIKENRGIRELIKLKDFNVRKGEEQF